VVSLALLEPAFTLAWPPASTFFWTAVASLPVPQSWRDRALAAIGGVSVEDVRVRTPLSEMIALGSSEFAAALPMPTPLSAERLSALRMPVYVAIAQRRSLAGGRRAMAHAQNLPRAQVELWPDTTHSLPMQVHEKLGKRLLAFWAEAEQSM
jgi:pimeloyl-ACP methyl ester carboxylesterase